MDDRLNHRTSASADVEYHVEVASGSRVSDIVIVSSARASQDGVDFRRVTGRLFFDWDHTVRCRVNGELGRQISEAFDNDCVEATSPTVHISRRIHRDRWTGEKRVGGPYWAEYFTHGKQYQESLKTSNKAVALRRAYALAERLERGQQTVRDSRRTIQELSDAYLAKECKLSEKSIYHETIVIKQLFKWAAKDGYISRNLLAPIRFEKVRSPKPP